MSRPSPQQIFNDFNMKYFGGRLPRFIVRKDFKPEAPAYCDSSKRKIHLPIDIKDDELEAVILHEMVHAVTGGEHDDAFRSELRRIASLGEEAAARELALDEWHAATERLGERLAHEEPDLEPAEVRQRIMAAVGPQPGLPDGFPSRGMTAWHRERAGRCAADSA